MFQYHCLNPIAEKGLGLFDEEYKKSEDLQECDAVLVRSAKMHDMELPESVKVIARAGACLLYTSPSPRDGLLSRMPSSA